AVLLRALSPGWSCPGCAYGEADPCPTSRRPLHDALPILDVGQVLPGLCRVGEGLCFEAGRGDRGHRRSRFRARLRHTPMTGSARSEEHTSELQSRENLVCRLLLEKTNEPPPATPPDRPQP